jgi:hypothetical protein
MREPVPLRAVGSPGIGRAGPRAGFKDRGIVVGMVGGAVLLPLLLYLLTMPPTIAWWFGGSDSGELVSAAESLGIAHPTGYPLFVLLGYAATRIPIGDVAARVNAMNAVLGALGAGGIVLTVAVLTRETGTRTVFRVAAGLLAAIAIATSSLYWSQAIIAEVYILHAALTALVLLAWAVPRTHPVLRGAAHGLALTNHLTSGILLVAALLTVARPWKSWWWRPAAWFGLGLALALSLYLLLPVRAAQDPIANWGNPDTLSRFLEHVTGREYRSNMQWHDVGGSVRDIASFLRLLLEDVPLWLLPAAGIGMTALQRTRPRFLWFTVLSVAGVLLFTASYRIPDRAAYLLPVYVIVGVWSGIGLLTAAGAAARWAVQPSRRYAVLGGALLVLALLVLWPVRTYNRVDLSGDDSALVFARSTLEALPPGATYFSSRDDVTFALWYAQRTLGIRRDVEVIDIRAPGLRALP